MIKYNRYNIILLLVIIGTIIFFLFIMPLVDDHYFKEKFSELNNENNEEELVKVDTLKCSKSCCGLAQYPVPDEVLDKNIQPGELKNYLPSNFSCNFGNETGSGCVCLTQSDYNYLNNHGNNSNNAKCNNI